MPSREEVTFASGGERCAAWLYRPSAQTQTQGRAQAQGPVPCVILGHGFNGTRELGLDVPAECFAAAGLAALAFDYRHFGGSSGEPRQLIDIRRQLADYASAIAYARSLDGIDPERIAVWGTALGSGHALVTAARDGRLAAAVAQLPYAAPNPRALRPREGLGFAMDGVRDEANRLLGRPPRMIDVVAQPGSGRRAVLTGSDLVEGFQAIAPSGVQWNNQVTAGFMLRMPFYQPARSVSKIACPVLYCIAERDSITSPRAAIKMAGRTRHAEVRRYPIAHFEMGLEQNLRRVAADQSEFLVRHLLG